MSLQIGQSAPQFKSFDSEKNEISLSDFKGKPVVLLFFPLAFTGVCTTELCSVRDEIADYNKLNAEVIAISVDYGSIYENFGWMHGVSKRSAFVIDGDGIIRYAEVLENAGEIPNLAEVKRIVENL
jgi:peroxiredoxin